MTTSKVEQVSSSTLSYVVDPETVVERYVSLQQLLPDVKLYYSVQANPDLDLLIRLVQLGANFDTVTESEIQQCLEANAQIDQISYNATTKDALEIAHAYDLQVRLFSFSSLAELETLAIHAPNSRVCCRLILEEFAEWKIWHQPSNQTEIAYQLLIHSQRLGLIPHGLTFQVAAQQCDLFSRTYRFGW